MLTILIQPIYDLFIKLYINWEVKISGIWDSSQKSSQRIANCLFLL